MEKYEPSGLSDLNMTTMEFKKGEIIRATERKKSKGFHYIAVWEDFNEGMDFPGIMLTSSTADKYADNIPLDQSHIMEGHDFKWKATHFVSRVFIKLSDWGPFTKVGELTGLGINFIKENLQDVPPVTFDKYDAERRSA
ncbi:hypothetical protein [Negadavirga shengliensis]|uniref:Uncharacterized protein n=1 Tax=Negadavirga shengliensis TaxID=1389218 RepID=A0ABV9T5Y2_9BACT